MVTNGYKEFLPRGQSIFSPFRVGEACFHWGTDAARIRVEAGEFSRLSGETEPGGSKTAACEWELQYYLNLGYGCCWHCESTFTAVRRYWKSKRDFVRLNATQSSKVGKIGVVFLKRDVKLGVRRGFVAKKRHNVARIAETIFSELVNATPERSFCIYFQTPGSW